MSSCQQVVSLASAASDDLAELPHDSSASTCYVSVGKLEGDQIVSDTSSCWERQSQGQGSDIKACTCL